ncbi:hypothetical protein Kisp01_71190 [Kineosporia sp. NBRC 101677]|nr:hypothetical protein Kisp01_71190 [Kineosporia sp. NBRC 101677]
MQSLPDLLKRLEAEWERHDLPIARELRPGLPRDHVRGRLDQYGLAAPDEILDWWSWHDGGSLSGRLMTPWHEIRTFAECCDLYEMHGEAHDWAESSEPPSYSLSLFPVITTGAGGCVTVDTAAKIGEASVSYRYKEVSDAPKEWRMGSLAELVDIWISLFASNSWSKSQEHPRAIDSSLSDADLSRFPSHFVRQGFIL